MKKAILGVVAALALAPAAVMAKEVTTTLKVKGWHCAGCVSTTEEALKKVDGVKSVQGDKEKGTIKVTYDDAKATQARLEEAVASTGFKLEK